MELQTAFFVVASICMLGVGILVIVSNSIEQRSVWLGVLCVAAAGALYYFAFVQHGGLFSADDFVMAFAEMAAWALGR